MWVYICEYCICIYMSTATEVWCIYYICICLSLCMHTLNRGCRVSVTALWSLVAPGVVTVPSTGVTSGYEVITSHCVSLWEYMWAYPAYVILNACLGTIYIYILFMYVYHRHASVMCANCLWIPLCGCTIYRFIYTVVPVKRLIWTMLSVWYLQKYVLYRTFVLLFFHPLFDCFLWHLHFTLMFACSLASILYYTCMHILI